MRVCAVIHITDIAVKCVGKGEDRRWKKLDFSERFMGVVEQLSDLGVVVWATVGRCNKIQVEAEKKTV